MPIVPEEVLSLLKQQYERIGKGTVRFNKTRPITDKDYEAFSDHVANVTERDKGLNINTWKRVFRHILQKEDTPCNISADSCQIIAEYLNFDSWDDLMENLDKAQEQLNKSNGVESELINTPKRIDLSLQSLRKDDEIEIAYKPNRILRLKFIRKTPNEYVFATMSVSNTTKIQPGDIIYIPSIQKGYPLMNCRICRNNDIIGTYTAANDHTIKDVQVISRNSIDNRK